MKGNRFVGFADILGFRALLQTSSLEAVAGRVNLLLDGVSAIGVGWLEANVDGHSDTGTFKPHHFHFSDTVIFWTDILPDFNNLQRFSTGTMFVHSLSMLVMGAFISGIPLRVGIAFGETYIDETRNIIVGQPVIDAYLVEEAQDWIGGAMHSSVPTEMTKEKGCGAEYPVPLKSNVSLSSCAALDWVYPAAATLSDANLNQKNRKAFDNALEEYLAAAGSDDVRKKYRNTKKFCEVRRQQLAPV